MSDILSDPVFPGVTASDRGPPVHQINFEPYTDDNRIHDKNHSEKIVNTSALNDSRGQEREIEVCKDFNFKAINLFHIESFTAVE